MKRPFILTFWYSRRSVTIFLMDLFQALVASNLPLAMMAFQLVIKKSGKINI